MYNHEVVMKARTTFIRMRADEIVKDPVESIEALISAYQDHPARTSTAFHALRMSGTLESLVEIEDIIRRAAETIADGEWYSTTPIHEVAA